ncbi:MAG: hypothetical protein QF614_05180, partial [SAR324 cluster bacterium]|nr:hypothetical protein [SAR324 cluster bacterium]
MLTPAVATQLQEAGWSVVLWRTPNLVIGVRPELPANCKILAPESLAESAIASTLTQVDALGGFLHLHPNDSKSPMLSLDSGA